VATLSSVDVWDLEADVVILGSGLAGSVAAIEAFDRDPAAEIVVLEKMAQPLAGGASRCAAQYMYCPPEDRLDDLLAYQRALNEPNAIPEPVLRAWGEAVVTQRGWVERMAQAASMRLVKLYERPPDFPDFPGASCVEEVYSIAASLDGEWVEGQSGVWRAFKANLDARGIRTVYETAAHDLVQDGDTLEVFGVIASQHGRRYAVKARRAVIMCMGSFAASPEMQREYAGYPEMYTMGCPANTGDGIKMLQRAGADLWHLRAPGQVGGIFPAVKVDDFEAAFFRAFIDASSWIDVAADHRRFYDETADYEATHFKLYLNGRWVDSPLPQVIPVHMIFDERTRVSGNICLDWAGWNAIAEGYRWSRDNSVELDKGWIVRADSIRDLALAIDRDPDELDATVARYNAACAAGHDEEFGRDPARLVPIDQPPYYALPISPGIGQAGAGGRRDERARVVSHLGAPIPRLYEAGELGSTMANLYQNGSFLTEAIAFGRIAGANAVAERPWG
jgi:succinate dehydrogenase/fumarate reductase flavoprotein subunit